MLEFKIDNEIKQEYLSTKINDTAKAESFTLRSADEYEKLVDKKLYDMNYLELKELIAMQYKNSSVATVTKNICILKRYVDFCIKKRIVEHSENRLETFTSEDAIDFVHKQAITDKFITKEKLREYQNLLYNEQDRLLLELPFIGIRGRAVSGGTLEEIINLSMPIKEDENKNFLTLTQNNGKHRRMKIDSYTMNLIREAYEQEVYVENNGEETNNRRLSTPRQIKINKVDRHVLRTPGRNKFKLFTPNLLNSRMVRLKKWLDNPYLSFTSLYHAGMVQQARDIYEQRGEITTNDYKMICIEFGYGSGDPDRYWFALKSLFEQSITAPEGN